MYTFKQYIDGQLIQGEGRRTPVVCPGTDEVIGEFISASEEQAQMALQAAEAAFPAWSKLTVEERGQWMMKLKDAIEAEKDTIAEILSQETGKPYYETVDETGSLAASLTFFLTQAKANNEEIIRDPNGKALNITIREPLGVIVGYLAWNFPMYNLCTKIGPVLASGCTAVIKPATKTPLATLFIGELMHRIGFPKGVFNIIAGSAKEISTVLTKSKIPAMLSLIGSSNAGRELVRDSATSIKRLALELGGNAPVIITKNADIELAAKSCMGGKMTNCGQICTSAQRVFVERSMHDAFVAACKQIADGAKYGTMHEDCNVGPLITKDSVTRMQTMVEDARQKGAKVISGGKCPAGKDKGNYFELTLLDDVTPDMLVFREEAFGPILAIMAYDDLDQAIKLANDTEYGLSSYVFSREIVEVNKVVRGLHFGVTVVNGAGSGIHVPHGGVKESGVGKDGSHISLDEYYYIKSIRVPVV